MNVILSDYAWLPVSELGSVNASKVAQELTIWPRHFKEFNSEAPAPIYAFKEKGGLLGVPREYFLANAKFPHQFTPAWSDGRAVDFKMKLEYRDGQEETVNEVIEHFGKGNLGAILTANTGSGKSVMALGIAARLGRTTIIVAHTELLMRHWQQKVKEFMPRARVGIIKQDCVEWAGKDIVIASLQTLISKELPRSFYENTFGLCIYDETHHVSAAVWCKVAPMFHCHYRLGITATLKRADGTDHLIQWHLGKVIDSTVKQNILNPVVKIINTGFMPVRTREFNIDKFNLAVLINILAKNDKRNSLIADLLLRALAKGRKIMVLSHRVEHLVALSNRLRKLMPPDSNYKIGFLMSEAALRDYGLTNGKRSQIELERVKQSNVLFCTVQFASEGVDIPALDTLFMVTPVGNPKQSVGRILREHPGKKNPVVVDFVDGEIRRLNYIAGKRINFYNSQKWQIT